MLWECLVQGRSEFALKRRLIWFAQAHCLQEEWLTRASARVEGTYQLQVRIRILEERLAHAGCRTGGHVNVWLFPGCQLRLFYTGVYVEQPASRNLPFE